jgi:hypothetical protein
MKQADDRSIDLYSEIPVKVEYYAKHYIALDDIDDTMDDYDGHDCFQWFHYSRGWLIFVPLGY